MPSTLFDSAGLAIVAYVQVNGADGSSVSTALANSGVSTTKILGQDGGYLIQLSTALGQDPSRDLIFVQPMTTRPTANPATAMASAKTRANPAATLGSNARTNAPANDR